LIEAETGRFEPEKMPDKYAETLRELHRAKVEQRAPQIEFAAEGKAPQVINIMDALKQSMNAKGRAKVRDAVRRRTGKPAKQEQPSPASRPRPSSRRTALRGAVPFGTSLSFYRWAITPAPEVK